MGGDESKLLSVQSHHLDRARVKIIIWITYQQQPFANATSCYNSLTTFMTYSGYLCKKRLGCMLVDLDGNSRDLNGWLALFQHVFHFEVNQCSGGFELLIVVLISVIDYR